MTKNGYQDLRHDLKIFNDFIRGKSHFENVEIWLDLSTNEVWVTPFYNVNDSVKYDSNTIFKITVIAMSQDDRDIVDTIKIRKAIAEIEQIGYCEAYTKAIAKLMTR